MDTFISAILIGLIILVLVTSDGLVGTAGRVMKSAIKHSEKRQ